MRIGIISDTHNNLPNLDAALRLFEQEDISTLVHCGDFTGVDIARRLAPFQTICVLGNGDFSSGEIRDEIMRQNPGSYVGLVFSGNVGGVRIAVTHGHIPGRLEELLREGKYDYVFQGHSHQHKDERYGITRLINPGSLGGLQREERRVCLLDLDSARAEFVKIQPGSR